MSYTLICIDMQGDFITALRDRVRKNCLREIIQAIKDKAPIIFLEWEGYGKTLPELMDPVQQSNNYFIRTKNEDDGSFEVQCAVSKYGLPKNFKVCGINTDCCVFSTVEGLSVRFAKANIEVISDAIDSNWNHNNGLKAISELNDNVSLV